MRLSDAIALGRTLVVLDPSCYQRCLIGLGYHAIGKNAFDGWLHEWPDYPWLRKQFIVNPPFGIHPSYAYNVISMLAHKVKSSSISMEQAIDWIRSVEPEENTTSVPEMEEVMVRVEEAA